MTAFVTYGLNLYHFFSQGTIFDQEKYLSKFSRHNKRDCWKRTMAPVLKVNRELMEHLRKVTVAVYALKVEVLLGRGEDLKTPGFPPRSTPFMKRMNDLVSKSAAAVRALPDDDEF